MLDFCLQNIGVGVGVRQVGAGDLVEGLRMVFISVSPYILYATLNYE